MPEPDNSRFSSATASPFRRRGLTSAGQLLYQVISVVAASLDNVFLIPHPYIGLVLWFAVGRDLRHAAFGVLGLAIAIGSSWLLGIAEERRLGGGLRANSLLAAIAASWLTAQTIYPLHIQIAMAAMAAVAAFNITAAIMRAMDKAEFPSLLWGYCLVAGTMCAMFPVGTRLAIEANVWWQAPLHTPLDWTYAFLRSLGSLMFAPSVMAGAIVAGAIFFWSRAAFVCGLIGWAAGTAVSLALLDLGVTFLWLPASYNFFVAGMALGATFFLPNYSTPFLAVVAGVTAAFTAAALQYLFPTFAYLPISSALTIWMGIGTLTLAGERSGFRRNESTRNPPEDAQWQAEYWSRRIGQGEPLLVVPLPGIVEVTQGFDDSLSHTGRFRHGLDFQRPVSNRPPDASPTSLWGEPVTAPAPGFVERLRDGVADNPAGVLNYAESWGNHVCIRLDQGGWAVLAHLRQGSVATTVGARVEAGTFIGAVGNSGRSPAAHLHLHVQRGPAMGAPTVPFRLANFQTASGPGEPLTEWNAAAVPAKGSLVVASSPTPAVHAMLAGLAPGNAVWSIEREGDIPLLFREKNADSSVRITRHLDELGRFVFRSRDGGQLILYVAPDAWRIVEQRGSAPLLRLLALGIPTIPYAAKPGLSWSDMAPATLAVTERWFRIPLTHYTRHSFVHARLTCATEPTQQQPTLAIESTLTVSRRGLPTKIACTLDRVRGPVRIEATFPQGRLVYSVMSFQPGAPFEARRSGGRRPFGS